MRPFAERLLPFERLVGKHFANQIAANEPRTGLRFGDEAGVVEVARGDHALQRTARAQPANERTRINRLDRHDSMLHQVFAETSLGAEVALRATMLADNEPGKLRPLAFDVL